MKNGSEEIPAVGLLCVMALIGLLIYLLVQTLGCKPLPGPARDDEAGTPEDCPAACARLEELQCPGWQGSPGQDSETGTPDDISCTEVCTELLESDITMTLFPVCTANAATCAEIDRCFEGGGK
jgi:hypothetical protein